MASADRTSPKANTSLSRRSLFAGAGGAFAAGLLPLSALAQSSARVVVVGGGWGGISAARTVKSLLPNASVTMVEPKNAFMSCPLSIHYIVGQRSAESLTFDFSALAKDGVRHVQDSAESIDRDAQIVVTKTERLPYDFLVLSPGISYMEDAIPGFSEHRDKLPVGFRAFEQQSVKQALDAYESGNIVLSVPPMPYRCPIAPYERAAMIAEWMNRHNKPGKIILLDQNPDIPIGKPIVTGAFEKLYKDRIEHVKGVSFESVNAETKTIETDVGKLTYGMASLVPPQQAAGIIRDADLGGRWAKVRFPNFQAAADDKIYVIGDSVGAALPKSGHLALESGMRVAEHIAERAMGNEPDLGLDMPSAICFASFSETHAMEVNVSATWDDFIEEIKRKPKAYASPEAVGAANDWSTGVWAQLLG